MSPAPILRIENLSKVYRSGDRDLIIFHDLSLEIAAGEQVAIIGESGAGKSTLLHLIAGLDTSTQGSIYYKGTDITKSTEPDLSVFRNREIGYVWQQHHLLPEFTAEENVSMPCEFAVLRAAQLRQEHRRALRKSVSRIVRITGRVNSPAASSSASPSRAHWPQALHCFSRMNPPEIWMNEPD